MTVAQLNRRREAGRRLPPVTGCGRSDPWRPAPPTSRGLADALAHLLANGMTGLADRALIREAWTAASPEDRDLLTDVVRRMESQ